MTLPHSKECDLARGQPCSCGTEEMEEFSPAAVAASVLAVVEAARVVGVSFGTNEPERLKAEKINALQLALIALDD